MNPADERAVIAEALYEEYRVDSFREHGYAPMWHELEAGVRLDWFARADRVQQALMVARVAQYGCKP